MDRSSCCGSTRGCLGTSCRHPACALHPPREPIRRQGGGPPHSRSPGDKNPRGTSTNRHLLSIAMWPVGRTGLVAFLLAAAVAAEPKEVLEFKPEIGVSNGGLWGTWAWQEMCPEETYATGFSLKVEAYRGPMDDDTALNGIRLFCTRGGRGDKHEARTVESQSGPWGQWSPPSWCPEGTYLTRFSLRVEQTRRGIHDDMGATNARFACSGGANLEGRGLSWGEYGEWSPPCRKGMCGIQTKQDPVRGALRDDTALNDVRFFCCSR
ncbi:vitelline membrane outer layer protein 1 homolog [Lacerta agilis]|uniref:vitelline membrane outer layer protein 1 homolog n=1 Tax=Lacerta agilis TaxID=80427 RepID=UPI001419F0D3|nr:vitelline membrane outer layer protein 1 homolog [Lacerta agilis]